MTPAHTPGTLTACPGNARALYNLETSDSKGNDLLPIATCRGSDREANAARLALDWNTLAHLDNDVVERLGRSLARYNSDELRDLLADDGF